MVVTASGVKFQLSLKITNCALESVLKVTVPTYVWIGAEDRQVVAVIIGPGGIQNVA
jgi:hypothetical protein